MLYTKRQTLKLQMQESFSFHVHSLFVYPIKACAGIRLSRLRFTADGLIEGDRKWVIVDSNGEVTWQGSHPRLALIRPAVHVTGLMLSSPGESTVPIPNPGADSSCDVRLWNDATKEMETYTAFDAGAEAARLLERVTNAKLRLVRLAHSASSRKSINPVHLVSLQSAAELNQFLEAHGALVADMSRFRPNVVLGAADVQAPPFVEEQMSRLYWGQGDARSHLTISGKCIRCVVPNVDPNTAELTEEPLRAVSALSAQRYPGEPVYFGVYGKPNRPSELTEGENLDVELSF